MKETFVQVTSAGYRMTVYNGRFGGYAEGTDFEQTYRMAEMLCLMCVMEQVGRGMEALAEAVRRNPLNMGREMELNGENNEREKS